MICVLQRVSAARVRVDGETVGDIDTGLLALVAVVPEDGEADIDWMAERLVTLRVFADGDGRMNLSVRDVGGALLVVSQFTLAADARRGRRPSFTGAAPPEEAERTFEALIERLRAGPVPVETGVFGAGMEVELTNQGPVTLLLDSRAGRGPEASGT